MIFLQYIQHGKWAAMAERYVYRSAEIPATRGDILAVDAALTVSDPDSVNLSSAVLQITGNYSNSEDILNFANMLGVAMASAASTSATSSPSVSSERA